MKVFSPWTTEEVENLNMRQKLTGIHPYTCKCGKILVATITGWTCPNLECDYHQNWAHDSDLEERK